MAGLIEDIAKTAAVLHLATGALADGKPITNDIECLVFETDTESSGANPDYGEVTSGKVFYLPPLASVPCLPAWLTVAGVTYDVASVQTFKTLGGECRGYCLTVKSAASGA